jgi:hypothetical protein
VFVRELTMDTFQWAPSHEIINPERETDESVDSDF